MEHKIVSRLKNMQSWFDDSREDMVDTGSILALVRHNTYEETLDFHQWSSQVLDEAIKAIETGILPD